MTKECFKCTKVLPITCFYKHARMADGRLNKCKECTKKDVLEHRLANLDKIRAYDRERGNRQARGYIKTYRMTFPNKYKAKNMVNNAIRDNKLFREPCETCGNEETHAHHDDYLKPLNVRWLCAAHHSQWHALNGEGKNG